MNTLLIELLTEELPPKALKDLGQAFETGLLNALKKAEFLESSATSQAFATPRRLAVLIDHVLRQSPQKNQRQKLMPASIGLDAKGNPTAALLKKLRALSVENAESLPIDTENGMLFLNYTQKGQDLATFLNEALPKVLSLLPIPKMMSYQLKDGWTTAHFVRPVHRLLALFNQDILPLSLFGLSAGNQTLGHRLMGKRCPITIQHAAHYETQLWQEGFVMASFEKRLQNIQTQLSEAAQQVSKQTGKTLHFAQDDDLLAEVTALTECPKVYVGHFNPDFLKVPQECLILTMKANQKYFPLLDENHRLFHQFLLVANLDVPDARPIIHGNERVLKARLSDAQFFFEEDKKTALSARAALLEKVRYHHLLGNQWQRCQRVQKIAQWVTQHLDPSLQDKITLATTLFKTDLNSEMVGEFPELQGIMGRYYALNEGIEPDVAWAIEEHYQPRFAGDSLPKSILGQILALSDKTETLIGLFGIGQLPTGDKDPFSLRRAAIGLIRLLTEGNIVLNLSELLIAAQQNFTHLEKFNPSQQLVERFIFERFAQMLQKEGFSPQAIDAVFSLHPSFLNEVPLRLNALVHFLSLAEASHLCDANKRVQNILKKSAQTQASFSIALLLEPAEKNLFTALENLTPEVEKANQNKDYTQALSLLARLKIPLETFFKEVMVNVQDEPLRNNRLALLQQIAQLMQKVADLSKL